MITASEVQVPRAKVVRVFLVYADFRVRVDDNSPVHYDFEVKKTDTQGMNWLLTFRVFALDRKERLMIFEHRWPHSYIQTIQRGEVINELVEKLAEPLNATPGRIEVR